MRTRLPELAAELRTTDRTLRRAVEQGLVHARRPSPRALDLPLSERRYLRRAWPLLSRLRAALRTEPRIRLAVLFGSRARGDFRADSDVDLLVDTDSPEHARRVAARLGRRLELNVQVVTFNDAMRTPILIAEILRDGRVLVDRDRAWPRLREARPSAERAAARERRRIERDVHAAFAADEQ